MAEKPRFKMQKVETKTFEMTETRIIVDQQTGVNYLWHAEGTAGGLTVLVDATGKPIVTQLN